MLTATPALAAAPDDWPTGDWAASCADADSTYCIADATITPVGGQPTALADQGLTATATTLTDNATAWVSWGVDGWDGQPSEVTGGEISLSIRTSTFVPRFTTAAASGLTVSRSVDDAGNYTLTVTGHATPVAWSTADFAADCAAVQYCGEYDDMADEAGTGYRFEGRTQDLDGDSPLDGAYLYTDAQARTGSLTYTDEYLWLGMLGNVQLDVNGDPVRNHVAAWLPDSYFAATGTTPDAGFDLQTTSDGQTASVPVTASATDGGVLLDVPDIGVGAAMGELKVYPQESAAGPNDAAPGPPHDVTVTPEQEAIQVEWQEPESDGGSPVTGYRARAFDAETGGSVVTRCDAEAGQTSCEIPGLEDGVTYYVSVSAFSTLGEGPTAGRTEVVAGEPGAAPPSEPRLVKVAPGANRLTVTWAVPESDGGAPIDYYSVQAYRTAVGGEPVGWCEADAPRRTCTLTGLPAGARIYVGVTATNEAGAGPEQPVRPSAIAWTVAGAPRSVAAKSARSKVTVSWAAPVSTGGIALSGYRAELYTAAKGGSVVAKCTVSGSARTCTTGSLKAGKTYYATVTALNAVGGSAQPARVRVLVRR
jgi:hypothetical protein